MENLVLKISTQSATFRIPEFQNFHKSFMLPPPTTIIGLIGAALGLSPKAAQRFFNENDFKIGVAGTSKGKAKDLWKYNDFKNGSIIKKEVLFHSEFVIVIHGDNPKIEELRKAFSYPVYALTLGNSDSLAKVKIVNDFTVTESDELENCIVAGNIAGEVLENISNGLPFSIYSKAEQTIYEMPTRFDYESDYGVRRVVKRKLFSIIGRKMKLNLKLSGITVDEQFVPYFSLE
ncbi:MAG TPA: CRISPR-associated protein Cas5 [Clostridiales bacterium]|nr:CRISPR-associated protein Cas5 [Clostridiales bacterium]